MALTSRQSITKLLASKRSGAYPDALSIKEDYHACPVPDLFIHRTLHKGAVGSILFHKLGALVGSVSPRRNRQQQ